MKEESSKNAQRSTNGWFAASNGLRVRRVEAARLEVEIHERMARLDRDLDRQEQERIATIGVQAKYAGLRAS